MHWLLDPVTGPGSGSRLHPVAEAALAYLAGAAAFGALAALSPLHDIPVLAVLVGVAFLSLVVLTAMRWGPLYAVPVAIAGGFALDSFYIPPLRDFGAETWENWPVTAVYIGVGVVIGALGTSAQRRAEASERARGLLGEELAASRARIVAATDEERQRVVRDMHDGAQSRLVHVMVTLKLARRALDGGRDGAAKLIDDALDHATRATSELRELAHGIHPVALRRGGLRPAVEDLTSRMPLPVELDVQVERLPAAVEATAYFVVAEALTNVRKHSRAKHAAVTARVEDDALRLQVRDDGVGGARTDGSGLVGLSDRLSVLGGTLEVESPPARGTVITATLPARA